jgi:1-acyl-sn-glycerol-3-phosphate acyltransferase
MHEAGKRRRKLDPEIEARIDRIPINTVNDSGQDEFGFNRESLKAAMPLALFLYEKWFRVETEGIENIPAEGPALITPNHSGQLPLDGMMIAIAAIKRMEPPRLPRSLVEKWLPTLPFAGRFMARVGQVVGVTENAEKLLTNGELVMIFPEGALGSGKTWDKRYQIQRFTHGFVELAIKRRAPIIPTAVIGGEEQAPSFHNVEWLAKRLHLIYFPITPTFPWLGALGLIPLPSKYRIYFGKPIDLSEYQDDLKNPDRIHEHVERVRETVRQMVNEGLKKRPFPGL